MHISSADKKEKPWFLKALKTRRNPFFDKNVRKTGFIQLEVTPGFEPGNEGFADPCLTTWLCHRTVSPLVSILYEAAFVKRETAFPAAFLWAVSADGGDAGKAPSRRTALAFILHPAGCPAAPAHPRRCCRCRGCVPPGSSGSCLRRWPCLCRRRGIRRSRIGHG